MEGVEMRTRRLWNTDLLSFLLGAGLSLVAPAVLALNAEHNVAPGVSTAVDLGPVDPAEAVNVTVLVKNPNEAAFAAAIDKLYDPASPTYHHWMTDQDLEAFAPPAESVAAVRHELQSHGLHVISADRFSVRVRGPAAKVQEAFQTSLHLLQVKGKAVRAHVQDARLTGAAGSLVAHISGLDQHRMKPSFSHATVPGALFGKPPIRLTAALDLSTVITDICLQPATTFTYTTPDASLPVGTYTGNVYNPVDASGNPLTCDFTAHQLQQHYGLDAAYRMGIDGKGQTIVLLEGYGYPTMLADANAFSQIMGLPPLGASNFSVDYPEGIPNPALGIVAGWDLEIALDIQWSHSMAPGANILVVATYGQDSEDFEASIRYIVNNRLGTVISDSWEEDIDLLSGPDEQDSFTAVLQLAAAKGVSFQFSSGDGGDGGLGTPVGAAGVPANSPYATAVGGTAILNNPNGPGFLEIGWGDDFTFLEEGASVLDPPEYLEFFGGSGGGESVYFSKPWWQAKLPGTGRQTPDISALADPYTGVPIVITSQGTQYLFTGVGGTSLASPIVTAILALATQKAGHSIGQAAPLIASLPHGAVTDILPLSSPGNLSGTIIDSSGSTFYSPSSLFTPFLYTTEGFISADYPAGPGVALAIAFGMDSSLTVTKGWDNATGFGVPNGVSFIEAAGR
jgi:subtilase family serine protease